MDARFSSRALSSSPPASAFGEMSPALIRALCYYLFPSAGSDEQKPIGMDNILRLS